MLREAPVSVASCLMSYVWFCSTLSLLWDSGWGSSSFLGWAFLIVEKEKSNGLLIRWLLLPLFGYGMSLQLMLHFTKQVTWPSRISVGQAGYSSYGSETVGQEPSGEDSEYFEQMMQFIALAKILLSWASCLAKFLNQLNFLDSLQHV